MDFLGFLKGENYFLEFLNKKNPPTAGRTGSPDRGCGRDPLGLRCGSASYWPAAADPAAGGVAGRGVGHRVVRPSGGGPHQIRVDRLRPRPRVVSGVPSLPPFPLRYLTAAPVLDKMPKKKGRRRVEVSPAAMVLYAWATGLQGALTRFPRVVGLEGR
jgi:hypothetical protein